MTCLRPQVPNCIKLKYGGCKQVKASQKVDRWSVVNARNPNPTLNIQRPFHLEHVVCTYLAGSRNSLCGACHLLAVY